MKLLEVALLVFSKTAFSDVVIGLLERVKTYFAVHYIKSHLNHKDGLLLLMGCNSSKCVEPEGEKGDCFRAGFLVDLKQLFKYYVQVANFVKDSPIFSNPSR